MKYSYKATIGNLALLAAAAMAGGAAEAAETVTDISTTVKGTRVDLTWNNPYAGETLLDCGFENADFPDSGWSTKVTNNYSYMCSWFRFPGEDFIKTNNYRDYIHSGDASAMMYLDINAMRGDHDPKQDEWLITPSIEGASYLQLYYYMDAMILEYGAQEGFPDHYYVKASYDDGATWDVLWDAQTDASSETGWHSLILPLQSEKSVKVAFQGVSDTGEYIHFLWAVDDVKISASRSGSPLVKGYTVKLDGETLADHLNSLEYTDLSSKEAGSHTYEIFAETSDGLLPVGSAVVSIDKIDLLPPTDVTVDAVYDDMNESYTVSVKWNAPTGGAIDPVYYKVYCDGVEAATFLEDTSIDFWGYSKGIYDFKVSAVYQNPDGESELIGNRISIDTRFNVRDLTADVTERTVKLSWKAPEKGDIDVSHYVIWRANECIEPNAVSTEFNDVNALAGNARYYVTAVYSDGFEAIPAYVDVVNGESAPLTLPFSENFEGGHLPAGWSISNMYDGTPDNLLWQFDDPNRLNVTGGDFDGNFASIDCVNSGFYVLDSGLETPWLNLDGLDIASLSMEWTQDFASNGFDGMATVEILSEPDGEWIPVDALESYDPEAETTEFKPEKRSLPIGDYLADEKVLKLRWHYTGVMDYHLAIDNVKISDKTSGVAEKSADRIICRPTSDGIEVLSSEGIASVSIYSIDGSPVASVDGGNLQRVNLPLSDRGIFIVSIRTISSTHTLKTAL